MIGFWISQVKASGDSKPAAEINLKKGANVITGPSDTGKSYLFSVINYVLGRTSEPDNDIPEGYGYKKFTITIETYKNEVRYLLERYLGENQITIFKVIGNDLELVNVYKTRLPLNNPLNISNFLLDLCELDTSVLLKNRLEGRKQLLSFKNINQFTSIAEERIITKSSPFYFTENNANHILEQSMISLILDGQDFSNIEAIENSKVKETRISGKLEFIESQIIEYAKRRDDILKNIDSLGKVYIDFNDDLIRDKIDTKLKESFNLENEITTLLKDISELTEDKNYHEELINRFRILERLYLSDVDRLEFIIEAESLTSQLPTHLCPICSNPMDENQLSHLKEIENFKQSVTAESQIIGSKISDLKLSIIDSETRIHIINEKINKSKKALNSLKERNSKIEPETQILKSELDGYLNLKRSYNNLEFIDNETENLYFVRSEFERIKRERETTDVVNVCDFEILKKLSGYIQNRLEKWKYEDKVKVIFNPEFQVFDIVISNKGRGSFGKGKRAISYTACLLGFLDYCLNENKKFSNLIILDSPLTTFKGAEDNQSEEDLAGLDEHFFMDLNQTPKNAQIIIFENKVPPYFENLNVIEFTRSKDVGRYGFYPV